MVCKVVEQKQDVETYYKYAQKVLKSRGNFKEADKQMQQFAQLQPNDQRAKPFLSKPNYYLPELKGQSKLYDVTTTDSSDKSDFGAVLTNDNNFIFQAPETLQEEINDRTRAIFRYL